MVQWLPAVGWVVVDDIEGVGKHDIRLHWLAADFPFDASVSPFQVVFSYGQSRVRWNIFSSSAGKGAIIRAGVQVGEPPALMEDVRMLGWESPTYGNLRPAVSLLYQVQSPLPLRLVTIILTDEQCTAERRDGQLVVVRRSPLEEPEVYRVSLSATAVSLSEETA
jgi:hypothetical protein